MPAKSQTNAVTERDEDGELLAAVAERRDRAAFAQLVERHQQALFALAQYLAHDRARAEEAVQDALLQVWNRADRFEYLGPGSVRAWLLRVTANESIRAARSHEREARRVKRAEAQRPPAEPDAPPGWAERRELLAALRAKLEELSGADRKMVALYYGVGLDQQSIAAQLDLSQQAVSHRLKRVLETLRESLTQGGFAAALPLLDTADLGGALHGGAEIPEGFADRVAFSLARESVRSMRVAAIGGASYAALTALLLLGAGGVVWWQAHRRAAVPTEGEPPAAAPAPPVAKLAEEIVYTDTFDEEKLRAFWEPERPANTNERLSTMLEKSMLVLLAGGRSVSVNLFGSYGGRKYGLNQCSELSSIYVALDERPVEIVFGETRMLWADKCYTFEGEVLDGIGRVIFRWRQSRTKSGDALVRENTVAGAPAVVKGPKFVVGDVTHVVADRGGRIAVLLPDGRVWATGILDGGIERLRICFRIEVPGAADHNGFCIDAMAIKRLASWPAAEPPGDAQRP